MWRVGWFGALVIASVTCAAAGGGSGSSVQASCTFSGSAPGASLRLCDEIERVSPQDVEGFRASCATYTANGPDGAAPVSAQFTYGPCSRVDAIGGCQTASGSTIITRWYYDDGTGTQTPSGVQMACTTAGGVFVQV